MKISKNVVGTNEWAVKTVNCCTGCSNDCRYCYARGIAVRFERLGYDDWKDCQIRPADVAKKHRKYDGRVMFPSSHDITPDNFEACHTVLGNLLKAGNEVLVVSKPYVESIETICRDFAEYKHNIMFRFTIGACDDEILSFWEPGAPAYKERKEALKYAFDAGFETSVSTEPILDTEQIFDLVKDLTPFITHSLWLGKMNYLHTVRIDGMKVLAELERIRSQQTNENITAIYDRLKDNPIIKWKDSIKKVVGIKQAEKPGMDM